MMSSEEILKLVEHAKLNPSDLLPVSQTLVFGEDYGGENNITLFEVDSDVLGSLTEGKRLVLRGESDEFAVLCTDEKTYEIKEAETSNSCIISPSLEIFKDVQNENHSVLEREVLAIKHNYYELRECRPRLNKLLKILESRTYKEGNNEEFGFEWSQLCSIIQSSEKELLNGLKKFKAYFIKGKWSILDFDYHFTVLSLILNLIDSNSMSIYALDKEEIIDTLKGLQPVEIITQCFDYFFSPLDDGMEGKTFYKINNGDVCRICAEVLLKSSGKFNLPEFVSVWQQSVPEGVNIHLSQLRGVAVVNEEASPPVIWHLPSSSLPSEVTKTLAVLFEAKPKWSLEDIEPYLEDFISPKLTVSALLTKYARSSIVKGSRIYSAKYP